MDVVPNSVTRERRGVVVRAGVPWVPIFCAGCGVDGGMVPEESIDSGTGWVCYLCDECATKYGDQAGFMVVPDMIWAEKFNNALIEKYGRLLTEVELLEQLRDPNSLVTKLARERPGFGK